MSARAWRSQDRCGARDRESGGSNNDCEEEDEGEWGQSRSGPSYL
jgi:hypothetical protein